ncbi:hypothetical protein ACYCSU_16740 [Paenibacillus sp. ALE1]
MGMYTGMRCKVVIKPEYREELEFLHNESQYEWSESNYSFMQEFGKLYRATFIPCGVLSYMPDSWEDSNECATDGFERTFDKKTGYWTFQCSLKNYDNEIEIFFENVLSKIAEQVIHLEYFYEEWEKSVLFDLADGQIVESKKEGIKY